MLSTGVAITVLWKVTGTNSAFMICSLSALLLTFYSHIGCSISLYTIIHYTAVFVNILMFISYVQTKSIISILLILTALLLLLNTCIHEAERYQHYRIFLEKSQTISKEIPFFDSLNYVLLKMEKCELKLNKKMTLQYKDLERPWCNPKNPIMTLSLPTQVASLYENKCMRFAFYLAMKKEKIEKFQSSKENEVTDLREICNHVFAVIETTLGYRYPLSCSCDINANTPREILPLIIFLVVSMISQDPKKCFFNVSVVNGSLDDVSLAFQLYYLEEDSPSNLKNKAKMKGANRQAYDVWYEFIDTLMPKLTSKINFQNSLIRLVSNFLFQDYKFNISILIYGSIFSVLIFILIIYINMHFYCYL